MNCNNEWDQLEEIIVGTAHNSTIPFPNKSLMSCLYTDYEEDYVLGVSGSFPDWLIEEQEEDLQRLSNTLENLGVKVHRPFILEHDPINMHYHCPRDLTLIIGNTIIETPTPMFNRQNETKAYKHVCILALPMK